MRASNSSIASLMIQESTMEDLMLKRLLLPVLAAALLVSMGYAQSSTNATITVKKTTATSGQQMYFNYCASCHGVNGKGDGPAAAALKMPPTDLTALSRNNHGEFPETHIVTVLEYGSEIPSHGSAGMPVWGPILGKIETVNPQVKQLRISNLIRYLKTLQAK
jgi:mono/diheme cytochrome c family protein